jgi:hypothetical protein
MLYTYPAYTMFEEVIYIIYLHTQTYTHSMDLESRITIGCEIKLGWGEVITTHILSEIFE